MSNHLSPIPITTSSFDPSPVLIPKGSNKTYSQTACEEGYLGETYIKPSSILTKASNKETLDEQCLQVVEENKADSHKYSQELGQAMQVSLGHTSSEIWDNNSLLLVQAPPTPVAGQIITNSVTNIPVIQTNTNPLPENTPYFNYSDKHLVSTIKEEEDEEFIPDSAQDTEEEEDEESDADSARDTWDENDDDESHSYINSNKLMAQNNPIRKVVYSNHYGTELKQGERKEEIEDNKEEDKTPNIQIATAMLITDATYSKIPVTKFSNNERKFEPITLSHMLPSVTTSMQVSRPLQPSIVQSIQDTDEFLSGSNYISNQQQRRKRRAATREEGRDKERYERLFRKMAAERKRSEQLHEKLSKAQWRMQIEIEQIRQQCESERAEFNREENQRRDREIERAKQDQEENLQRDMDRREDERRRNEQLNEERWNREQQINVQNTLNVQLQALLMHQSTSIFINQPFKSVDVSDLSFTKPTPAYLTDVQSLPNREGIQGCTLKGFPIYYGNDRWVPYLNTLLRHAKEQSWGHKELLLRVEDLSIFSIGMAEGVREYIENTDLESFRSPTDKEAIHGRSPEITRKLIHLIEWLCQHFYQPQKGDPRSLVYQLRLWHYQSLDLNGKVCLLHGDKILSNLKSRLKNNQPALCDDTYYEIITHIIMLSSAEIDNHITVRMKTALNLNVDNMSKLQLLQSILVEEAKMQANLQVFELKHRTNVKIRVYIPPPEDVSIINCRTPNKFSQIPINLLSGTEDSRNQESSKRLPIYEPIHRKDRSNILMEQIHSDNDTNQTL
jgi:hypothetical protein